MQASFCPQCGSSRVGELRYCAACGFDLDVIAVERPAKIIKVPQRVLWKEPSGLERLDLAQVLATLRHYLAHPRQYAGVVVEGPRGYVQFQAQVDAEGRPLLHAEAASNRYLGADECLNDEEEARLRHIGWQEDPSGDTSGGNYWMRLAVPVSMDLVVGYIESTFRVYGVGASQMIASLPPV
jgi:hypothetical protein